jgi:hypothetical protein
MDVIFSEIYENYEWGNNRTTHYKGSSGIGSKVYFNLDTYIPFLKKYILDNNIKTIVDLGCGDFLCGHAIYDDLDIEYVGYDVYEKLLISIRKKFPENKFKFYNLDFYDKKAEIIGGDLCILKDVIQHWNLMSIYNFLDYLVSVKKFKYILIINCCDQKEDDSDIETGQFRQLSANFLPLMKYNPKIIYKYKTKEVSLINCKD